jgi:hypothetical protein
VPRNKQTKDSKKAVIQVRSLADLTPRRDTVIHLELEQFDPLPTLAFDIRQPSYSEWIRYGNEVPTPQAPLVGISPDGVPEYNLKDENYLRAQADYPRKIEYNRLIHCLVMDIDGDTLDEKIAALEATLSWGIVRRLLDAIVGIGLEGERRVVERADTFLDNGHSHPSANGTARVDVESVPLVTGS